MSQDQLDAMVGEFVRASDGCPEILAELIDKAERRGAVDSVVAAEIRDCFDLN